MRKSQRVNVISMTRKVILLLVSGKRIIKRMRERMVGSKLVTEKTLSTSKLLMKTPLAKRNSKPSGVSSLA